MSTNLIEFETIADERHVAAKIITRVDLIRGLVNIDDRWLVAITGHPTDFTYPITAETAKVIRAALTWSN